jgi:ketosteroid isomerase-like protein
VSPEDLRLIRSLYDAMNRRDLASLRAYAEENPDFEWQSAPDEPDSGLRRGSERTFAYTRDLFETFERLETEIREVIDLGPDAAIFAVHHRVRGAASGAEVERGEAHLWTKRDGRVASLREYATVQEARDAAGEESG